MNTLRPGAPPRARPPTKEKVVNKLLHQFAQENPEAAGDGFVLLVSRDPVDGWSDDAATPWALFRSEAAARDLAGRLTEAQLIGGFNHVEREVGDEIVIGLLEFRAGQRFAEDEIRRIPITEAGLNEYRATLPIYR
jgi:hypothetical protein